MTTGTRPDPADAVRKLSRFVAKSSAKHVGTLKRYLAGTLDYDKRNRNSKGVPSTITLEGFCDSDWANDPESRKSNNGMARRQSGVALSTAEVEYVAACEDT
ncbi:Integrase, catalytic core protein [Phytophthora megakarya]|uniref:Integrase, catalytic core protein n=1 Tax=Phytophthora megakarya TaxID=4795 RepID=A0A225VSN4_9STRA|nr:Integrase, catalytic core protein [Phytophthora megakarya]